MISAGIKAKRQIQHSFSYNNYLGIFDSRYMLIARSSRAYLMYLLTKDDLESPIKLIDKQIDNLALAIKNIEVKGFDVFQIHNRREELLAPNQKDLLNTSIMKALLAFEKKCL